MQLTRNQVITALRVILTIIILYALLKFVGARSLKQALLDTEWAWLAGMYVMTMCFFVTNSSMLHRLLTQVGLVVRLRRVAMANALSTMYSLILPSDVLAGLVKWADLSAATGDKSRVLSAMVFAKLALAIAPLFFGTLALTIHDPFPDVPLSVVAGIACSMVVVGTVAILNSRIGPVFDRRILAVAGALPVVFFQKFSRLVGSLQSFRQLSIVDHLKFVSFSVAAFGFGIAGFYCAVRATGESVAITALLWISLALFIARLVPITVSNLGVREGIVVYTFAAYGIAPAPALLVGLLMFSNTILIAVFGALYQSALALGWLQWSSKDA